MSVCQYVRMQIFSLGIKMQVVHNVIRMSEIFFLLCQYVAMSVCQYVRMQIFSLGIKMKVVQNVIMILAIVCYLKHLQNASDRQSIWQTETVRQIDRVSDSQNKNYSDRHQDIRKSVRQTASQTSQIDRQTLWRCYRGLCDSNLEEIKDDDIVIEVNDDDNNSR